MSRAKHRTAGGRALAKAIRKAGGELSITGKGHFKVTGPAGVAFVVSDPENNRLGQVYDTLRKYAGLDIRPGGKP